MNQLKTKVSEDVKESHTLPGSFYRNQEVFEQQKEKVFASSWQYLTDLDIFKRSTPNSLLPITLLPDYLDEPLLLSKEESGRIHLLSNVCTHRGSILVDEPRTNTSKIGCRYHGRCFAMDGQYVSAPGFEEACNFPRERDNLPKLPFENFAGFAFTSLNPKYSFTDFINSVKERLSWLPLEQCEFDQENSRIYNVKANWALYVDNYLEGLHIPFVHPSLASMLDTKNYKVELNQYGNVQIGIASDPKEAFQIPTGHQDHGKNIAAYYYWLFPNLMLNFYTWGVSVNVVEPIKADQTRVRFLTFVYDRSKMDSYSPQSIDQTELEDEAVVEAVQKGIQSRLYDRGRYAPGWENGVHQFHRMLSDCLHPVG